MTAHRETRTDRTPTIPRLGIHTTRDQGKRKKFTGPILNPTKHPRTYHPSKST